MEREVRAADGLREVPRLKHPGVRTVLARDPVRLFYRVFGVAADDEIDARHLAHESNVLPQAEVIERDHHVDLRAMGADLRLEDAGVVRVVNEDAIERVLRGQVVRAVVSGDEADDADAHAAHVEPRVGGERRALSLHAHVRGEHGMRAQPNVAEHGVFTVRKVVVSDRPHVDRERLDHEARRLTHRAKLGDRSLFVVVPRVEDQRLGRLRFESAEVPSYVPVTTLAVDPIAVARLKIVEMSDAESRDAVGLVAHAESAHRRGRWCFHRCWLGNAKSDSAARNLDGRRSPFGAPSARRQQPRCNRTQNGELRKTTHGTRASPTNVTSPLRARNFSANSPSKPSRDARDVLV
jgi:hypothetical protein